MVMGKKLLTDVKYAIFKNWLGTRLKMETNEPNVHPTILGGVSRGFCSPFEDLGARSAIFWHLKMGTFAKSARFLVNTQLKSWSKKGRASDDLTVDLDAPIGLRNYDDDNDKNVERD